MPGILQQTEPINLTSSAREQLKLLVKYYQEFNYSVLPKLLLSCFMWLSLPDLIVAQKRNAALAPLLTEPKSYTVSFAAKAPAVDGNINEAT